MTILYLLIIWLTPIVICFLLAYIDMDKGESIKEYFDTCESNGSLFLLIFPGINILFTLVIIFSIIYDKIGDIRK